MKYFLPAELHFCYFYLTLLGLIGGIIYPFFGDIKKAIIVTFKTCFHAAFSDVKNKYRDVPRKQSAFMTDVLFFFLFFLFYFLIIYAFGDLIFRLSSLIVLLSSYYLGLIFSKYTFEKTAKKIYPYYQRCIYVFFHIVFLPLRCLMKFAIRYFCVPAMSLLVKTVRSVRSSQICVKKIKSYSVFLLTRAREYDNINI